ncbi:hypothetical protein D3C76_964400 [compost metagenome]
MCSALISKRLDVHKAVGARRADGQLVKVHCIKVATFDPGNFRAHQRSAVLEILGAMLRPDLLLAVMRRQGCQVLLPFVG